MDIKNYKLEIKGPKESVTFGPRNPGESGRDILIIKNALGAIEDYSLLVEGEDAPALNIHDPNGWFDCIEGKKISDAQAATFDSTLQDYVRKYQLDNQFYILCYYFIKYAIPSALAKKNAIIRNGVYSSPIENVIEEDNIADWISSGKNKVYLAGGKSIEVKGRSINDYRKHSFLSNQIEIITKMFDSEFGRIGEATLAIMHGWLPRTSLFNEGYKYDPRVYGDNGFERAYDIVLLALFDSFIDGNLSQKIEKEIQKGIIPADLPHTGTNENAKEVFLDRYKRQVSIQERIDLGQQPNATEDNTTTPFDFLDKHFGGVAYDASKRNESYESIIFQSLKEISDKFPRPNNISSISAEQYDESLKRMLEPDPFIDPDPFIIDDDTIGYFYKTEYTLQNLPPHENSTNYEATIREIEDLALTHVMSFYGKPEIFYLDTRDPIFQELFIGDMRQYFNEPNPSFVPLPSPEAGPRPVHDGKKLSDIYDENLRNQVWVLCTEKNYRKDWKNSVQLYNKLERTPEGELYQEGIVEPLIKFVEFRTPSLRPGDMYRAKFFINKRKLDYISKGFAEKLSREQEKVLQKTAISNQAKFNIECSEDSELGTAKDNNKRRYEEYKAIAAKNKKEIARILREKTLEAYENNDVALASSIDIGIFGDLDLSNPITAFSDVLGTFDAQQNAENPDMSDFRYLSITYPSLVDRARAASRDLKKAYELSLNDQVQFNFKFNAAEKAMLLQNLPPELKLCIQKHGDSKFDFNDGDSGLPDPGGLSSLKRFSNIGLNEIEITFNPVTASSRNSSGGLEIEYIKAGNNIIIAKDKINEFPSLRDPIVVSYLAQIYDMTGGAGASNFITSFFTPPPLACKEIGIGKRGVGYLTKHTPGLKGESLAENPIQKWYQESVEDPFNEWYESSKDNLVTMFEPDFNTDAFLSILGKQCSIQKIYSDFKDKISLSGFICNFLKCIRLPALNISIPKLNLPPLPIRIDIFGWFVGLIKQMIKKFFEILVRILCSFLQMILDFLSFPFCQEQLRDELYGELSNTSPMVQQALVDGLTDLGIPNLNSNISSAKDFIDSVLSFLTGQEICRLLEGEDIDPASMAMIEAVANKKGLQELNSPESIKNFFETLGVFLPDFCDDLEAANWIIATTECEETTSLVEQYRRRMMAGEATEEDLERALDLLNKNLKNEAEKLQAFGEKGIEGLLPDVVNFGNPNAILNKLPSNLEDQANETIKQLFEPTKMSYLSSLSAFGPGLFFDAPRMPGPEDEEFDEVSFITVSTIIQNLNNYASMLDKVEGSILAMEEPELIAQLNTLHMIYDVTEFANGKRYLKNFRWVGEAPYDFRSDIGKFYTTDGAKNFAEVGFGSIADEKDPEIVLKPIGYREFTYFDTDDSARPASVEVPNKEAGKYMFSITDGSAGARSLDKKENGKPVNLDNFSFQANYLIEKKAEKDIVGNKGDDKNVILEPGMPKGLGKQVILIAIKNRIDKMQQDLLTNLNKISTPSVGSEYLGGIRDLFSFATETINENLKLNNQQENKELIDIQDNVTASGQKVKSLLLNLQSGGLTSTVRYNEFPSIKSAEFDPYSIEIYNDNMFRRTSSDPVTIEVCDKIPGPDTEEDGSGANNMYRQAISELNLTPGASLYTRRELFARRIMSTLHGMAQKYYPANSSFRPAIIRQYTSDLDPSKNSHFKNGLKSSLYSKSMEGIFEQIFFALEGSRIYDEEGYYPGLNKRVAGQTYVDEQSGNGEPCVRNRYNVSQLGILSFEKMITDEIPKQLSIELSKPENQPSNIDYDAEGPVEKAIQSVCFIGFIRVCLVELLLKGAMAYSVWDFEGVFNEKIFEEFIFEYVKSELNRQETMKQSWEKMTTRITGIGNPDIALKKLVRNQSMKMLDVSKKIYQNKPSDVVDYHNWYSKYFIPQTHCSRQASIKIGTTNVAERVANLEGDLAEETTNLDDNKAADKIYWSHPLLEKDNIIIEDLERRISDSFGEKSYEKTVRNISGLVNGNDPFFHIEHLAEVRGPLASIESIVIPGSLITERILNADVTLGSGDSPEAKEVRKVTTTVTNESIRTPIQMNIKNARARTSLKQINLGDYGFEARPQLPDSAAGAATEAVEELLGATGEVDPLKYAATTEVYNIRDLKASLNFKVSNKKMNRFLNHMQGLMYYPDGEEEQDDTEYPIRDAEIPAMNGLPEEVLRMPTKFIKKTRRIIKFSNDFVSHVFDDFYNKSGVEDYKRSLFGDRSAAQYLNQNNSQKALSDFNKFSGEVESVREVNEYYIVPDSAERLYKIFQTVTNAKAESPEVFVELSENIFKSADNPEGDELRSIVSQLGEDFEKEMQARTGLRTVGDFVENSYALSKSRSRNSKFHGFEYPGLVKVIPKVIPNTAGVTVNNGPIKETEDIQSTSLTTRREENSDPVAIFENKIGKFATEQDYENAITTLLTANNNTTDRKPVDYREEHWVETVYEFSGDSSILGGLYGSYTIGETMDPAALNFEPDENTKAAWLNVRNIVNFYDGAGRADAVLTSYNNYLSNPFYSYGRTFWPAAGSPPITSVEETGDDSNTLDPVIDARIGEIPYIARPMGIDKFTNCKLTSKVLTRYNSRLATGGPGPTLVDQSDEFVKAFAPFGRSISISPTDEKKRMAYAAVRRSFHGEQWDIQSWAAMHPVFLQEESSTSSYRDVCKIIHSRPKITKTGNNNITITNKKTDLLPPNIYKIPLRVLVTQVYVNNEVQQAFCRVVPPKYIRNLKVRPDTQQGDVVTTENLPLEVQENISYLNKSITSICNEYRSFTDELQSGIPSSIRTRAEMVLNYFLPNYEDFPEFTKDFYVDFNKLENYSDALEGKGRKCPKALWSHLDLNSSKQYCSIERIYSEAFNIETKQNYWNSKEELDLLFSENRGSLFKKGVPTVEYEKIARFSMNERIRHLESIQYFYNLPKEANISSRQISSRDFHRTIISINNVLQWFLRYRRHDSLWGMMTPQDTKDVTTTKHGYAGQQRFPLNDASGRSVASETELFTPKHRGLFSPWQIGCFNTGGPGRGPRIKADDMYRKSYAEGHRPDAVNSHKAYITPLGAISLAHNWINFVNSRDQTEDEREREYVNDNDKKIAFSKKDLPLTNIEKYLTHSSIESGISQKINNSFPLLDGYGDFYVNYNRINSFPMLQNGTSLFVADGRLTMDDVSTVIKSYINSLFSITTGAGASIIEDIQNFILPGGEFFKDAAGNFSEKNYKLFVDDIFSFSSSGELEIDMSGISNENNSEVAAATTLINVAFKSDRMRQNAQFLADEVSKVIDKISVLLDHLIVRTGAQIRFQTYYENDGHDSLFTSNHESLKQLGIMKRFLEKIKTSGAEKQEYVIMLLVFLASYDFGSTCLDVFGSRSKLSELKKKAEEEWALVCMMWLHLWMAWTPKMPDRPTMYTYTNSNGEQYYRPGLRKDDYGRFEGICHAESQDDCLSLHTMMSFILYGRRGEPFGRTTYYTHYLVSNSDIRAFSKGGRVWARLCHPENDNPDLTWSRLKKFLEGGDWNYNPALGRNITNQEIISYVHKICKWSHSVLRRESPNEQYYVDLYGGDKATDASASEDPASIIREAIRIMGTKENFKYKRHKTGRYNRINHTGKGYSLAARTMYRNLTKYAKSRTNGPPLIDSAFERYALGPGQGTSGFKEAIQSAANSFSSRNSFKESLYVAEFGRKPYQASAQTAALYFDKETYSKTSGESNSRKYRRHLRDSAMYSKMGIRKYTYNKMVPIYNNDGIASYQLITMMMKMRWVRALMENTGMPQKLTSTLFDQAALINNQVIEGLFEKSKIDQVSRLVINFPDPTSDNGGIDSNIFRSKLFQQMSEEQRSIIMTKTQALQTSAGETERGQVIGESLDDSLILSVPIAEYREPISKFGQTGQDEEDNFLVNCYSLDTLVQDFNRKTSWMSQELLKKESSKMFLKFIFPTRRYQALATIFATTSLSSYSTMPSLMSAPKSSLSFLMGITSMTTKERMEIFKNMSQAELFKQLSDNKASEPRAMSCFDLPFSTEFLEQFLDMLLEQIKEFPAVLFRGLANTIDPAYREMKLHWDDCSIQKLTYSGVRPFTANKRGTLQGGLIRGKYAPLLTTTVADLGYSIGMLFSTSPSKGAKGLAHTMKNLTGYIYKGPVSLLDGAFQFSVPCLGDDDPNINWPQNSSFNFGRYGHPFTPLTYIALAMPELRGDKRLREMSGRCEDESDIAITRRRLEDTRVCNDDEASPFGSMPKPEDFSTPDGDNLD